MSGYQRTLDELRKNAVLHWPDAILSAAEEVSTLPLLLKTQDNFISVLKVASKDPLSWYQVLEGSNELNGALFLKHLMVLSDMGGEALNKLPPLEKYIKNGEMIFDWGGNLYTYKFKKITEYCTLTNLALGVDSKNLIKMKNLTDKGKDICMLLLFGSRLEDDTLPTEVKDKCVIGELLGKTEKIDEFVKQRYLFVSKQVSGAQSNSLGQITQVYVADMLKKHLDKSWEIKPNYSLPGVSHAEEGSETNFDIVVISPDKKYFGIEISFQVTTNSVIERKARESASLMQSVHKQGHKICYVIDGAGNINVRERAVGILCANSDCTVAMSESEIQFLADYFKKTVNEQ